MYNYQICRADFQVKLSLNVRLPLNWCYCNCSNLRLLLYKR